ncbi:MULTISPECIES: iron ABC transporter permease [Anaerococcus]|uniref:Probable ABC transporter permease protein HI_1471 n=1 Tax=Anaerococcus octavius TaxID=54007 RepID=A0A380WVW0_9FIRM|nr:MULTISPECIES: iron ABC transporter permease [Anaerococcus]MDU3177097.1 iron ABC transporter permease [Anaerococcus sp.]MDU4025208.1 iron ABC transporter permease [Anaerococcus sp.]MDU7411240.1 iron ABC transporter permease [Anaerococcus sp.]SUU93116.1 Probable ABC transporter permease protein HI_1471 [Anaerococcus octavius]
MNNRNKKIFLSIIILIIAGVIDLFIGDSKIALSDLSNLSKVQRTILFNIRLPEVLTSIVVGLSLGLGGAIMQTILNNPLADPFTLGISSAAGFGASLFLLLGFSLSYVAFGSIIFSLVSMILVFYVSKKKAMNTEDMILAGIAIKFFFDSLTSLLQYLATDEALSSIVFWLFGNVTKTSLKQVGIILFVLVVILVFSLKDSWKLTAMRFGEDRAMAMGVDIKKLKVRTFILVSILAAVSVSYVGIIGFLGILAPHFARRLVGEDQRYYLILSAVVGAVLLVISSMISKIVKPGVVIPIGIISSIIGLPLIYVMLFGVKND